MSRSQSQYDVSCILMNGWELGLGTPKIDQCIRAVRVMKFNHHQVVSVSML